MKSKSAFITLLLLLVALPCVAAEQFSSLEERMSGEEFRAAGLDKLSEQELANLNEWIRTHSNASDVDESALREQIRREVQTEQQQLNKDVEREQFTATIKGHFTGWTGRTVFELDNGQVWKQNSGGSYRVSMDDPTVVIYPAAFGSWRLRLEKTGPSIGVERVK